MTPRENYVGRSVRRSEDRRLLLGGACFLDDIAVPADTLYAAFVRSPHSHAAVGGIDTRHALESPGVVAVITGRDLQGTLPPMPGDPEMAGFKPTERPLLAHDRVRFVGDAVALVLGTNPYGVYDAVDLVVVDYEPLPPVVDIAQAIAAGAPLVHDTVPGNVVFAGGWSTDAFDVALAASHCVIEETFRSSRVAAVSIEPRGCVASFDRSSGKLTLWTSSQVPQMVHTALARWLGMPEHRIRVAVPDVGGGFGMKASVYPEEVIVAKMAVDRGVTIKWAQDRLDDFLTSQQARDHLIAVKMGVDIEGRVTAVHADIMVNIGAYASFPFGSSLEANGAARNFPGPYRISHFSYTSRAILSNKCPTGPYRGVAAPSAFFCMEGMLDRVARRLQLDPADVRRRNLVDQFPYTNVLGQPYDSGAYLQSLERALELVNYREFREEQRTGGAADGKLRGVGLSIVTEQTGMGASRYKGRGLSRVAGFEAARIKVEASGSVVVYVSQASQGQGHATAFAQVAADLIGVDFDDVSVIEGDTEVVPFGTGTFGSRGIVLAGGAVAKAAIKVRDKMRRIAAQLLESAPEDIEIAHGVAHIAGVPDVKVTVREIALVAHGLEGRKIAPGEDYGLTAEEAYDTPTPTISSAVHAVIVEIDALTGEATIPRYAVVHDCGRMINPMMVDGQIFGAVMQGIGQVLTEAVVHDAHGQLLTGNLLDYQLPTMRDLPRAFVIEGIESLSTVTETGFKGVGESGIMGAVPAVACAVGDALAPLGVSVVELPLTASRISALIAAARARTKDR